jgi:hypothetical protein
MNQALYAHMNNKRKMKKKLKMTKAEKKKKKSSALREVEISHPRQAMLFCQTHL